MCTHSVFFVGWTVARLVCGTIVGSGSSDGMSNQCCSRRLSRYSGAVPPIQKEGVRQRLIQLLNDLTDVRDLFYMTIDGLHMVSTRKNSLKVLIKTSKSKEEVEELEAELESAERDAGLYKKHEDDNFTNVTEMYVVYLWGKVDNLIKDVLTEYIDLDDFSKYDKIPAINLPLAVLSMTDREKKYYIISQIEQKLNISLKQGVAKFEEMLKVFDMGGNIPKKLRDKLFELSNVRNIIAHNSSFADDRFISNCPWMGYSVGERLKLSPEYFGECHRAVFDYLMHITFRLRGEDVPEEYFRNWLENEPEQLGPSKASE